MRSVSVQFWVLAAVSHVNVKLLDVNVISNVSAVTSASAQFQV